MEIRCMRFLILGSVIVLTPAAVFAQIGQDPSQQQMQQMQTPATPNRPMNPNSTLQDGNAAPGMMGQEMKDKIFLRKSAAGGIAEVKMGQLASDKGASDDVKGFGAKMVTDHTELGNELKPIADSMGVRLPKDMDKAQQAEFDKLNALSGDDFDKEYITEMVKDHRKDWREFHEETAATNDASLKAATEKGEGVIREHLRMISKIARDKGLLPARTTPPPPAQ